MRARLLPLLRDASCIHAEFDSNDNIEATAPAQQDEVHETIEPIHPFVMRTLFWSGTGYGLDFFGKGSMRFWLGWSATLAITVVVAGTFQQTASLHDPFIIGTFLIDLQNWIDAVLVAVVLYASGVYFVLRLIGHDDYVSQQRKLQTATLNVILLCGIYVDLYPLIQGNASAIIGGSTLAGNCTGKQAGNHTHIGTYMRADVRTKVVCNLSFASKDGDHLLSCRLVL